MDELAKPAIKVYQDQELKFVPERFGKIYMHWLDNIRDWCISVSFGGDTEFLHTTVRTAVISQ